VSGKGMPAAVVMTLVATAMRSTATRIAQASAAEMLQAVSDHVYHYLDETGTFVTMVVAVWTSATGELDVANAGHSPVLAVSTDPKGRPRSVRPWPPSCPPIGTLPSLNATSSSVRLGMGEAVLFGTDGLAEQEDAAGRLFGYEPLERLIEAGRWATADQLIELVFEAIEAHGQGMQASDDRTCLVLVRRAGAGDAS
jgi:phosphoserine phosphatase RsbU/P